MTRPDDRPLLDVLLNAWERAHRILIGLLRAVPEGGLRARAVEGGPTVAQLFTHVHSVRLAFVAENAPELGVTEPAEEWVQEDDPERIAQMLEGSARAVREAVVGRLGANRDMDRHFDHPALLIQMMIWHEGYHHGQIKLALKIAGQPIADRVAGPVTWGVWMRKTAH